jgi:hypothetical protein
MDLDLYEYVFARPVSALPEDLTWILTNRGEANLSGKRQDLYTAAAGIVPGYPEAFAESGSRDDALGQYGEYVKFVTCSWSEAKSGGFTVSKIAIGHALHDPGFYPISKLVIDAVAREIKDAGWAGKVVIKRIEYGIEPLPGEDVAVTALPQFGVRANVEQMEATMLWLHDEFVKRLAI